MFKEKAPFSILNKDEYKYIISEAENVYIVNIKIYIKKTKKEEEICQIMDRLSKGWPGKVFFLVNFFF